MVRHTSARMASSVIVRVIFEMPSSMKIPAMKIATMVWVFDKAVELPMSVLGVTFAFSSVMSSAPVVVATGAEGRA